VADYTEDACVIQPGVYEKDREEIRANIAAAFAGPLSGSRVAACPVSVRFVTGDTAIVVSEDGIIFPGQRVVRVSWVLVRRDGGWRVASYHNGPASWVWSPGYGAFFPESRPAPGSGQLGSTPALARS
jgi:uncharacterized protein (TIGR02246 family)